MNAIFKKETKRRRKVGNHQMYIKEYTAIIVQARNDKNLNVYIASRQKEQWEVLKVQLMDFGWKREKSRMPPNSVVLLSGNLVVAEVKVGKIER